MSRDGRVAFFRSLLNNLEKTPPPLASPNPPLAEYKAKVEALEKLFADIGKAEQTLSSMRADATNRLDELSAATDKMAVRAEDASGGSASVLLAIGFSLQNDSTVQTPAMVAPVEFVVTPGDDDGELDWTCRPVEGARAYLLRTTVTPNDAASWKSQTPVTRSSGTITGLPSGARMYVQVCAVGPDGPGPWSDVSSKTVP